MKQHLDRCLRLILSVFIRGRRGLSTSAYIPPIDESPKFVNENGVMVYVGKVPKDINWETLIDQEREARLQQMEKSWTRPSAGR